jgi:TLC domain
MSTRKTNPEEMQIPPIAQFWRGLSRAVPSVQIPFTNLNVTFTILSSLFLSTVRMIGIQILEKIFGWPSTVSDTGAASMSGIVHSSLLCPGLIVAFQTFKYSPSEPLAKAPKWWQELVDSLLQFCTGYMIYDACFIIASRVDLSVSLFPTFQGDDLLFLGHHLATTIYMTQSRVYQAGHMSAMMCMLIGEASNPPMNTWFITSTAKTLECCNGVLMQTFHKYNEILFCSIYLLLRVVVGPIVCTHMSYDLLCSKNAKEHLPMGIRLFWNFMIWAVILGSYSWIVYTYEMLTSHFHPQSEPQQEL